MLEGGREYEGFLFAKAVGDGEADAVSVHVELQAYLTGTTLAKVMG